MPSIQPVHSPPPIPHRRVAILCLILFVNECNVWMLHSYLPFMLHFLLPQLPMVQLGYFSAILGGSYYVGALGGCVWWGATADRIGRRPVLLLGLISTAACSCFLGFTRDFWSAVAIRALWGVMNTTGVGRTCVTEVWDDSNRAQGMVLFSVVSSLGRMIGALIGGYTSSPASHHHLFQDTFFETYPFALPALLSSFWSALTWLLSYYELEESLPSHRIKALCSLCGSSKAIASYSVLSTTASEDFELDESVSPMRQSVTQNGHDFSSSEGSIELRSTYSTSHSPSTPADNGEVEKSSPDNSNNNKKKKKKGVTFNSYVQQKIIDTSDIRYERLNKITEEDLPLYFSADDGDNDYNRSGSLLEALRREVPEDSSRGDDPMSDLDSSSHRLVQPDELTEDTDTIEKFTNGSELEKEAVMSDFRQQSIFKAIRTLSKSRLIYYALMVYFLLMLTSSAFVEVFPLWVAIPASSGGFGFDAYWLGASLFASGLVSLVLQLAVFPLLAHRRGLLPLLRDSLLVVTLALLLLPLTCLVRVKLLSRGLVAGGLVVASSAVDWAEVIALVLLNNSCYHYQRATVNGISQASTFLAHLLASLFASSFLALCESNSLEQRLPWPFHYAVVFWCIACLGNVAKQSSYSLHRKIQRPRREPRYPRYAVQMETFKLENEARSEGASTLQEP